MSQQGAKVTFDNVTRTADDRVQGRVRLEWHEEIGGSDVQVVNVTKDFDFVGRQQIADIEFDISIYKVEVTAEVFEKDQHTICIAGNVEIKAFGFDRSEKLDDNCTAIP